MLHLVVYLVFLIQQIYWLKYEKQKADIHYGSPVNHKFDKQFQQVIEQKNPFCSSVILQSFSSHMSIVTHIDKLFSRLENISLPKK